MPAPPSAADFRAAFEAAPDRYLLLTPDLLVAGASNAWLRATGTRREQIVGRPLGEVCPDGDAAPAQLDTPILDDAGALRFLLRRVGGSDEGRGVDEARREVDARSEQREVDARLRLALRAAQLGTWHCDLPLEVFIWDPKAREHFGAGSDERITRERFYQLIHPDHREKVSEAIARSIAGHTDYDLEYRVKGSGAAGGERWLRAMGSATYDAAGVPRRFDGVTVDVSARHRAEATQRFLTEAGRILGSSLDYQRTLAMVARLAVPRLADWCTIDMLEPDGSTAQLAAAHADPAKVALAQELRRRYPNDEDEPGGVPNVLRTGKPELYPEITDEMLAAGARDPEHLRLRRELGLCSAIIAPITSRRGTIGAITLVTAESGRRLGDSELQEAMELGARAGLAVENSLLYAQAQQAVRLRDEFLSIAGHELKTPLAALSLQVESLLRQLRKAPEAEMPRTEERLEKTFGHIARLARLVEELLDVSRITAGRLNMNLEDVDLSMVVREAVEQFGEEAGRAGCELVVRATAGVVGRWDRTRLEQLLNNLISNALKYGRGRPVEISLTESEGRATLAVTDHGIGIGLEDQRRIFGRFERAVSERHYGGLGLGLWIARQIVAALGGTIAVASEPGVETVFTVELPLAAVELTG